MSGTVVAPNNGRTVCTGTAYVMAGNPANVGHQGFPGVTVTPGSAAVIPYQFTGAQTGGPDMRFIGATAFGTVTSSNGRITESFNGLTQAVGASFGSAAQVQAMIMARDPGALVLELVNGRDLGPNASVIINVPTTKYGCPAGTHQQTALEICYVHRFLVPFRATSCTSGWRAVKRRSYAPADAEFV